MAFVRSPRGAKSRFSIARISHSISQLYLEAMGPQTSQWRQQIQAHAQSVTLSLRARLGDGPDVEWSRASIEEAIEDELRKNAPMEVHERFLEEKQKNRRARTVAEKAGNWDKFEAMETENPDRVDPAWTVQVPGSEDRKLGGDGPPPLADIGEPARKTRNKRTRTPPPVREPVRRSNWIGFWREQARLALEPMDLDVFERRLMKLPPEIKQLDPEGWWDFWQGQLDLSMQEDPRLVGLLKVALDRRNRALIGGQHWLAGTSLDGNETPLRVSQGRPGNSVYRSLWVEHIQRIAASEDGLAALVEKFDLNALAKAMAPSRDNQVDWRGRQWMALAEGVWDVGGKFSRILGTDHAHGAYEFPQWAWMRVAMALSVEEEDPMQRAIALYNAISTLTVIPSETMMREAGKRVPRFMEDEAGIVGDQFESIHAAIHRAAVNTKWTGTVSMDWRQVRSQGAPIAGRRLSQGPIGFMKPIHMSLAAQGRQGEDRPVTVTLPLWHRDLMAFLDEVGEGMERLQPTVSIPDLFFQRLQEGQRWTLLDPAAFPEADKGIEEYLRSEQEWLANPEEATGRSLPADRIWQRLLKAMAKGLPFITFEGSDRAFAPFPRSAPPVGGIDGVGAIPVPRSAEGAFVSWPAAAVNLARLMNDEGNPDTEKMRATAQIALRMLDNAITLSSRGREDALVLHYRPVCLGAIGFFEAVSHGVARGEEDPELVTAWVGGLAEGWATVVVDADQMLRRERGAAPAWKSAKDGRSFDPVGFMEQMATQRGGAKGHRLNPRLEWNPKRLDKGHRCSVRTVWAPFQGAARMAGVTPGGMGTLRPVEPVLDEKGRERWCPTPLLKELLRQTPEDVSQMREIMRHPDKPGRWPAVVKDLSLPAAEGWERRLRHAAHIRPWIDQGVSVTLPMGMDPSYLATLVKRAWWLGLSNIRFEGMMLEPLKEENIPGGVDNP